MKVRCACVGGWRERARESERERESARAAAAERCSVRRMRQACCNIGGVNA